MKIINENTISKDLATAFGISDILIDALNKKYESIRNFNSIKLTLDAEKCDDMLPVINSIIADENKHVGKLQELINLLIPGQTEQDQGQAEAFEELDEALIPKQRLREGKEKYYVSYYAEYPIYEPAEGGYYYAGNQLIDSEEFSSLAEAKARLEELEADLVRDGFDKINDTFYLQRSKYIGEDQSYTIETELGSQERGPVPFE